MKKLCAVTIFILLISALLYFGCDRIDEPIPEAINILPETFSFDIPDAISQDEMILKSTREGDSLSGFEIYQYFTFIVRIGEAGAEMAEHVIDAISEYQINKPMMLTYVSDDDGEVKDLVVVENSEFDGIMWEFQMTISAADSTGDNQKGIEMQLFWNRDPVKGIVIIKPSVLDYVHQGHQGNAMFRIDYSEAGEFGYDAHMIISLSNRPVPPPFDNPYGVKSLKIFAGKKGEMVDLYGNSNHPNAFFFSSKVNVGFNWAFVTSANHIENRGVAEIGLPKNNIDQSDRSVLLKEYSIKNVLTRAILEWNPNIPPGLMDKYLLNTDAPGYFNTYGFISSGEPPNEDYAELAARLSGLSPYNPKEVKNLNISFKVD